jgi:hypothetical protein
MDRGGRGYEEARPSSSLPPTLHRSLLQPGAGEADETTDTLKAEVQPVTQPENSPPYAPYPRFSRSTPTHSPSITPAPSVPTYEQPVTHRGAIGGSRSHFTSFERSLPEGHQLPTLPLPRIQTPVEIYQQSQGGIQPSSGYSELQLYAPSNQLNVAHNYNPSVANYPRAGPIPLPSLNVLQSGPSGESFYTGPQHDVQQSSAYRQRRIAPLPQNTHSRRHQTVPSSWNYPHAGPSSEYHHEMQSGMSDWPTGTRRDDLSMHGIRNIPAHRASSSFSVC